MDAEISIPMWCIFCVNGILTGNSTKIPPPNCLFMLLVYFRAWQRKLNALVKDLQQRAHMYACLWMLINEESKEKFYERLHIFHTGVRSNQNLLSILKQSTHQELVTYK